MSGAMREYSCIPSSLPCIYFNSSHLKVNLKRAVTKVAAIRKAGVRLDVYHSYIICP